MKSWADCCYTHKVLVLGVLRHSKRTKHTHTHKLVYIVLACQERRNFIVCAACAALTKLQAADESVVFQVFAEAAAAALNSNFYLCWPQVKPHACSSLIVRCSQCLSVSQSVVVYSSSSSSAQKPLEH